jgi:hypothetical protein
MPRYFFHLHLGDETIRDPEGQFLRDPDEAWEAARATAQDLMGSKLSRPIDPSSSSFEVVDEAGEIVLEFPFVEAIEVPPKSS